MCSSPSALSKPADVLLWCRAMTRTHSQTFYRGSLLYPPEQRAAVWAVYAACRVGDDITDSGISVQMAQLELDSWWAQIQAAYAGQPGYNSMQRALAWVFSQFDVPLTAFEELYAGFCMDLSGQRYHTLEELRVYCRRVAGVVGIMMAPIGGYRGGEETLQQALALGEAMQLTNILRDVGEDLRLGRLYLPSDLLRQHGVDVEDLRAERLTPEYVSLLREMERLARAWYAEGLAGIPQLEGRARYGVAVAARLYAGILDELAANGYDNLSRRAVVGGRRKLWLTLLELHSQQPRPALCPLSWAGLHYERWRSARVSRHEMIGP